MTTNNFPIHHHALALLTLTSVGLSLGCGDNNELDWEAPLSGGHTTIVNRTSSAFENPAPNLSDLDLEHHLEGDVAFEATFISAPGEVNPGLGPLFNNGACGSCHIKNGRGLPVAGTGSLGTHLLVRVSLMEGAPGDPGGPIPVPGFGNQLQDHAVYGHTPEVNIDIKWIEESGQYGDGTSYVLRRPDVTITLPDGTPFPSTTMTSLRIPPPVFGLGLLEAIPEETILRASDPDDRNNDGISGRPNYVWDRASQTIKIGRFSWKANVASLQSQAAGAYAGDMGVSNPVVDRGDNPTDIDMDTLTAVAFYTQTLAVPRRAHYNDLVVRQGEQLFEEAGCASCHLPTLTTGDHEVSALRNQEIHPYTDLLVHDMGPDLADARPDFEADGTEWRTSPLWGIGLTETVMGTAAYLNDGRAQTLEEAILWHGGEAKNAKEAFRTMKSEGRDALVQFLMSL